jgi:plastocyanin
MFDCSLLPWRGMAPSVRAAGASPGNGGGKIPRRLVQGAVLALALAAPLSVLPTAAQAAPAMVVMKNFDFSPMTITIPAGTSVTWKNTDGEPHTVTSTDGLFRSGALDTNDTFTFKFSKSGIYKYLCSIHPRMMAAVIVK